MKYLVKAVDQYRVDSEVEVEQLRNELNEDKTFDLTSYSYTLIETKDDSYYRVKATKEFIKEKDPTRQVYVSYEEV